jgi:hypothetical protein
VDGALRFFTEHPPARLVDRLESVRPAPVTQAERHAVVATLPAEGDVRDLDPAQQAKLAAARRILAPHGRDTVYEVRVIDLPQAAVALHGRAVVLVSEVALDLLDPEEFQALVAHEVGHDFFWSEHLRGKLDHDRRRLQTLELLCDGVAIVTLRPAGIDPARLTSAIEEMSRSNRARFGAARNEGDYPSVGDRRRFARRLVEWLSAAREGAPGPEG